MFCGPPSETKYSEQCIHSTQYSVPLLEVQNGRIQDAILNIMGARDKPDKSADGKHLATHEVQNEGPHLVNLAAVPLLFMVGI